MTGSKVRYRGRKTRTRTSRIERRVRDRVIKGATKTDAIVLNQTNTPAKLKRVILLHPRQVVRNSLTSEGFIIASESGDSTVASTKGAGGRSAEGPHVGYFINPNHSEEEKVKIKNAAQRVADILNANLPAGLGPFEIRPHTNLPHQTHYFGLWF